MPFQVCHLYTCVWNSASLASLSSDPPQASSAEVQEALEAAQKEVQQLRQQLHLNQRLRSSPEANGQPGTETTDQVCAQQIQDLACRVCKLACIGVQIQRERERFTSSPTFLCGNTPATLG